MCCLPQVLEQLVIPMQATAHKISLALEDYEVQLTAALVEKYQREVKKAKKLQTKQKKVKGTPKEPNT